MKVLLTVVTKNVKGQTQAFVHLTEVDEDKADEFLTNEINGLAEEGQQGSSPTTR